MLLVSFLLVIVATVFLVAGLVLTDDLELIYVSIACSGLAGVMLVIAVLRSRPRDREAAVSAEELPGPAPAPVPTRAPGARPAGGFPIDDYDSLEVVEVLPLLGDLSAAELEMVRQREVSGRAHPWILARVDTLLEAEAESGEYEWAPAGDSGAGQTDDEEEEEWAPPEHEGEPRAGEWAASEFELEAEEDGDEHEDYGDEAVAEEFPIEDYDDLRADEILPLLTHLEVAELRAVREVETEGKARTSILSRVDTLILTRTSPSARRTASRGAARSLAIDDYDRLTVGQITSQLSGLSLEELKRIRTYEKRHKARVGVLQRVESAIARAR